MPDTKKANGVLGTLDQEAVDRLKTELQGYALAQTERVLAGLGRKLGESTVKLTDIAEGRSPGFARLALDGGRKLAEGKGPVRAAVEMGASRLKDNVKEAVKGIAGSGKRGKKGGGGRKPTVIMESVDVGVPVREAYDQWTRYQDFSTFAKGVRSAGAADDTTSDWNLKVFWSSRSWKAHTTEQIPDTRIAWSSEGAKGTTKGVVTFHELGESLTRVLLVIEYYPKGLFEKTGNIWRAQGRRARLDLKNFARHISMRGEAEDGWRGEIRDGEVVTTHEEGLADDDPADETGGTEDEPATDEIEDTGDEEPYAYDDYEDEEVAEEGYEDESGEPEGAYAEDDGAVEDEPEEEREDEALDEADGEGSYEAEHEGAYDDEEPVPATAGARSRR
ncbi:cyclase [Streptomyces sp. NBC_01619]|uniref:SRPBCC family protein n=1 Tax=Streptomyces sp. NBC_01619 TaxID=2975901 RepID=UPI002256C880|nr:SRPBCC family protein [Streptomyces sp. NBC_01619]MCX4513759.1 cyclase [Streptomyces sp. NBC_01619]